MAARPASSAWPAPLTRTRYSITRSPQVARRTGRTTTGAEVRGLSAARVSWTRGGLVRQRQSCWYQDGSAVGSPDLHFIRGQGIAKRLPRVAPRTELGHPGHLVVGVPDLDADALWFPVAPAAHGWRSWHPVPGVPAAC